MTRTRTQAPAVLRAKTDPSVQMFNEMAAIAAYVEQANNVAMAQHMFWLFAGGSDEDLETLTQLGERGGATRKAMFDLMVLQESPFLTEAQLLTFLH